MRLHGLHGDLLYFMGCFLSTVSDDRVALSNAVTSVILDSVSDQFHRAFNFLEGAHIRRVFSACVSRLAGPNLRNSACEVIQCNFRWKRKLLGRIDDEDASRPRFRRPAIPHRTLLFALAKVLDSRPEILITVAASGIF
jgi:hypothetical protein